MDFDQMNEEKTSQPKILGNFIKVNDLFFHSCVEIKF
jgi:hypothetical protein